MQPCRSWALLNRASWARRILALLLLVATLPAIMSVGTVGYYLVRNKVVAKIIICGRHLVRPDDAVYITNFAWWPQAMQLGLFLANPGGPVHVPPNYSESPGSPLAMSKNNSGFIFEGPATITCPSAGCVTVSVGVAGAFIKGLSSPDNTQLQGVKFIYTGTGTAMLVGGTTARTMGLEFENFILDISGAGSSAIGIDWIDVNGGCGMKRTIINGAGGTNSQIGYQLDSSGSSFQGDCTFIEPQSGGVLRDWVINGNVQENLWLNGQGYLHATGTSICVDFEGTSGSAANNVHNFNCSGASFAVKFGGSVVGNKVEMNGGSATTASVSFGASTSHNYALIYDSGTVQWGGTNNIFITNGNILGTGDLLLNRQGPLAAVTGNGSNQTLYTFTIPANYIGPGKGLRVRVNFTHSTGTASVQYSLIFGSTTLFTNGGATTSGDRHAFEANIYNATGVQNSQSSNDWHDISSNAFSSFCCTSSTENTQNALAVSFVFNVAATDQVTPTSFTVELIQ